MNNKYTKDLVLLGTLIIGCSIAARFMARGETLSEYDKRKSAEVASSASISVLNSSSDTTDEHSNKKNGNENKYAASENSAEYDSNAADSSISSSANSSITNSNASTSISSEGTSTSASSPDKVTYMEDFSYEPLPQKIIEKITGISYVENENIAIDALRYCSLLYNDFEGNTQTGELICNKSIAQDIVEIFYELYSSGYQIESIKLIDEYNGDDTASMEANNTSCFNYRVVEGTKKLSKHAYGLAIDLNPFYNPYITYNKDGTTNVSPAGSRVYEDRSAAFPYKIDENDLACKLFKAHGFKWGGDWNSVKDYQHFEKK